MLTVTSVKNTHISNISCNYVTQLGVGGAHICDTMNKGLGKADRGEGVSSGLYLIVIIYERSFTYTVSCGTWEWSSLGWILIQILHGKNCVQIKAEKFSNSIDKGSVVGGVDGDMVAGIVSNPENIILAFVHLPI